jgi:protein-S-isoprenylcysteine O-methyltransferase Ste14
MESIYYAVKVVTLLWVLMVALIAMFGANKSASEDRSSMYFLAITLTTVLPAIGYTVDAGRLAPGAFSWGFPLVSYLGFFVFLLGLLINWTGILTLNKQWSAVVVISKDHRLIDTGIYKYIRHPIYTGVLLELLGLGLALANWITILVLVSLNAVSIAYRIFVEEKALEKHFGDGYIMYARKTRRLIPGIF